MDDAELEVDLFEHPEQQPDELRRITDKYSEKLATGDGDPYHLCRDFLSEVEELGFTFDYDLAGEPYELRPAGDDDIECRPPGPSL
ncbi:hypothetical protein [Marinobacter sp. F3R08]|uniref:hypothetical protein n=1 Tax=Marinobacter sp. F3R08 TaxID=2841559 RepID=UPI001C0A1309|nr:hypothetical protein [Marinobacter sp. F3R08]MBU2952253.1 hypothetical protein [Marinobacter sp. F3R08]